MITKKRKKSNQDPRISARIAQHIYDNPPPQGVDVPLSLVSERDSVWNDHRNHAHDVSQFYANSEFNRYADRITSCSPYLEFSIDHDRGLLLRRSFFCHVRNCPVCQWRKSLYWKAMMYQTYDKIKDDYADHRWLFLTLTLVNPKITDLRHTLNQMHKAWRNLVKTSKFKNVIGWLRTTEITRDKKRPNTHAHPHYHAILLVKPEYFSKSGYLSNMDWVRAWASAMGVDYLPNVDIRTVKPKQNDDENHRLRGAISETLKYAVKPSDMLGDKSFKAQQWFLEYTRQVHKMRFVASGGVLKNALKCDDKVTDQDMITAGNEEMESAQDKRLLHFSYYSSKRSYIYNPKNNS